ncbi:MAG: class I SAM-dependent methyltransferase [Usitatibacter sp.]
MLSLGRKESASFSLDAATIRDIFEHARPLGHHEDASTLNLGFGFLYYGLVRTLRPRHVVVIGSGYGFSVACLALALKDNGRGALSFVDPSYSLLEHGPLRTVGGTAKWEDPEKVRAHFARFGVEDIVTHYKETSADFFAAYDHRRLGVIDLAFIDGNHAYEEVRHDFLAVLDRTRRNSYMLMHDTNIYVREMVGHAGVKRWLNVIEREHSAFEVVDFPFSSGVALVRVIREANWRTDGE